MGCGSCRYYNGRERSGDKGHCDYIGIYVYPDDMACSHYGIRGSEGCFMTSACCDYYGLPDDCRELTMMRKLRDNYMSNTEEGRNRIDDYYRTAPAIVRKINGSSDREKYYEYIYSCITKCASQVESGNNEDAEHTYLKMFENVKNMLS